MHGPGVHLVYSLHWLGITLDETDIVHQEKKTGAPCKRKEPGYNKNCVLNESLKTKKNQGIESS